jgi:hypothetical protein
MQKCDFLTAGVTATSGRMKLADLTVPWMYDCYDLLFAVQDDTVNIDAVVKPFQWPVGEPNLFHSHLTIINLEIIRIGLVGNVDFHDGSHHHLESVAISIAA